MTFEILGLVIVSLMFILLIMFFDVQNFVY